MTRIEKICRKVCVKLRQSQANWRVHEAMVRQHVAIEEATREVLGEEGERLHASIMEDIYGNHGQG